MSSFRKVKPTGNRQSSNKRDNPLIRNYTLADTEQYKTQQYTLPPTALLYKQNNSNKIHHHPNFIPDFIDTTFPISASFSNTTTQKLKESIPVLDKFFGLPQ